MIASTTPAARPGDGDKLLPEVLLLLAHLICADKQIHLREDQTLRAFIESSDIDEETRSQIAGIFSQDPTALEQTPEQLIQRIPAAQQELVFQQLLLMAHADGYFSPEEQRWVKQLARDWGLTEPQAERLIEQTVKLSAEQAAAASAQDGLSDVLRQRFSQGARSLLFNARTQKILESLPKKLAERAKQVEQDLLLAGPEYQEAISRCKQVAQEDFAYAEPILEEAQAALQQLDQEIAPILTAFEAELAALSQGKKGAQSGQDAKSLREAVEQIRETKQQLHDKILADMEQFQETRKAKRRSLDYFTIAFMGKTKAGKSTLHSVLTNGQWNDIGVGKQRTTRYNRVYELDNGLRIVDTPGIGAPGGQTDTETAKSIIDEADVICFVATNDSIQESEFEFLKLLRGQAKPVIVLLNIKQNLKDERRLRKFLENPDKPFLKEGKDSIQGHINRIKRYAEEHYPNGYVEVVPVMLLAAQLSQEEKYRGQSEALYCASRMKDFFEKLHVSIVEHGVMRRSQTLLGSTALTLAEPIVWLKEGEKQYRELTDNLEEVLKKLNRELAAIFSDAQDNVRVRIDGIFSNLRAEACHFAEQNWKCRRRKLDRLWEERVTELRAKEKVNSALREESKILKDRLKELTDEVDIDIKLVAELKFDLSKIKVSRVGMNPWIRRGIFGTLRVLRSALFRGFNPLSIATGLAISSTSFILGRSAENKQMKRKEWRPKKIYQEIRALLNVQRNKLREQKILEIRKQHLAVSKQISRQLKVQLLEQKKIQSSFQTKAKDLSILQKNLNRAYAFRILNFISNAAEDLTQKNIEMLVEAIERTRGKVKIYAIKDLHIEQSISGASHILQEKLEINHESKLYQ